ncbi:MAG: DUF917 domain-containing protein [Candidatus Pacebacteria bacterium]|nr:DUF917 domain-containing protein [Candidatus Paceibacterota bacterium]
MIKVISKQIAQDIILGSSVYSTGGGLEYNGQIEKINKLFKGEAEIKIAKAEDFNDNDYVCTAYGVGSSANTDFDFSSALQNGFSVMQEITKRKFVGIFAGETNIEALMFETAKVANLPLFDADCTGGRAVPEINFDNLFMAQKSILPLVAITANGEVIILKEAKNAGFIEELVRSLCSLSKSPVAVLDHPISVKEAKKHLTLGVFERSQKLGELIKKSETADEGLKKIIFFTNAKNIFEGEINKIELKDKDGFLSGFYEVKNSSNICKIYVKNESLVCLVNNKVVLTCPDLIAVIDKKTARGVHNSKIKKGQEVVVLGVKATKLWRTKKALETFNPKVLGLNFPTKLL